MLRLGRDTAMVYFRGAVTRLDVHPPRRFPAFHGRRLDDPPRDDAVGGARADPRRRARRAVVAGPLHASVVRRAVHAVDRAAAVRRSPARRRRRHPPAPALRPGMGLAPARRRRRPVDQVAVDRDRARERRADVRARARPVRAARGRAGRRAARRAPRARRVLAGRALLRAAVPGAHVRHVARLALAWRQPARGRRGVRGGRGGRAVHALPGGARARVRGPGRGRRAPPHARAARGLDRVARAPRCSSRPRCRPCCSNCSA